MELYETTDSFTKRMAKKANELRLPFGGTIELTPLCNMSCKMCYVYKSYEEMSANGKLLTVEQWICILEQMKEAGVLYLLITGGEPLIYPYFKEVYKAMLDMGFLVTVNTNGTLINEEWADFFAKYRCRRFNITLYGKDDATYEKVCHNPKGFTSVMCAAALLKERNLPFTFTSSLINENADQMKELYRIAQSMDVPYKAATYMFPAVRRNICAEHQNRMSPEKAAQVMLKYYEISRTPEEMKTYVHSTLMNLFLPPRIVVAADRQGYPCRGGKSGFWVTWRGELTSCAMLEYPQMSLLDHPFEECWKYIVEQTKEIAYCKLCLKCTKQNICHICPAAAYTETHSFEGCPEYVCAYTDELIRCLFEYLSDEEHAPYEMALKNGGFMQIL